ncbi:MAG: hypothetical protein HUK11_08220 [Muribaculaceae bacterium]|nr:hypothetical protein [Muribaculaceae bacterium]
MKKNIFKTLALVAVFAIFGLCCNAAPATPAAQQKEQKVGPVELDLGCFKCKVPEGWKVKHEKAGNFAMLAIEPVNKDEFNKKIKTNFGFEISVNAATFTTMEKKCDEAATQYSSGIERSSKTIADVNYEVFHVDAAKDGGAGISDRLIAPLKVKGTIDISIPSLGLDHKAVKEFLNSIVLVK